jgi:hypothetical protein
MKAYITSHFNAGFGSTYDVLYRIYVTQEQLKKLGYTVKSYIDFTFNPYKMDSYDRDIFGKILNFDLIDNLVIDSKGGFNPEIGNFPERDNCELILNNSRIYYVYVDEKVDGVENLETFVLWQTRDDLPKISMLTEETTKFCENKLLNYPDNFYVIHYRPFELHNQDDEIIKNLDFIKKFINEHNDKPILFFSQFDKMKEVLKNEKFENLFFNDFKYLVDHSGVRSLGLNDNELLEYMNEVVFEMYAMSKSEKILRICGWFSNFLFFSNICNQTNVDNKLRYYPPYS